MRFSPSALALLLVGTNGFHSSSTGVTRRVEKSSALDAFFEADDILSMGATMFSAGNDFAQEFKESFDEKRNVFTQELLKVKTELESKADAVKTELETKADAVIAKRPPTSKVPFFAQNEPQQSSVAAPVSGEVPTIPSVHKPIEAGVVGAGLFTMGQKVFSAGNDFVQEFKRRDAENKRNTANKIDAVMYLEDGKLPYFAQRAAAAPPVQQSAVEKPLLPPAVAVISELPTTPMSALQEATVMVANYADMKKPFLVDSSAESFAEPEPEHTHVNDEAQVMQVEDHAAVVTATATTTTTDESAVSQQRMEQLSAPLDAVLEAGFAGADGFLSMLPKVISAGNGFVQEFTQEFKERYDKPIKAEKIETVKQTEEAEQPLQEDLVVALVKEEISDHVDEPVVASTVKHLESEVDLVKEEASQANPDSVYDMPDYIVAKYAEDPGYFHYQDDGDKKEDPVVEEPVVETVLVTKDEDPVVEEPAAETVLHYDDESIHEVEEELRAFLAKATDDEVEAEIQAVLKEESTSRKSLEAALYDDEVELEEFQAVLEKEREATRELEEELRAFLKKETKGRKNSETATFPMTAVVTSQLDDVVNEEKEEVPVEASATEPIASSYLDSLKGLHSEGSTRKPAP